MCISHQPTYPSELSQSIQHIMKSGRTRVSLPWLPAAPSRPQSHPPFGPNLHHHLSCRRVFSVLRSLSRGERSHLLSPALSLPSPSRSYPAVRFRLSCLKMPIVFCHHIQDLHLHPHPSLHLYLPSHSRSVRTKLIHLGEERHDLAFITKPSISISVPHASLHQFSICHRELKYHQRKALVCWKGRTCLLSPASPSLSPISLPPPFPSPSPKTAPASFTFPRRKRLLLAQSPHIQRREEKEELTCVTRISISNSPPLPPILVPTPSPSLTEHTEAGGRPGIYVFHDDV
ncbi:hypothetical protein BJ546DRAFT_273430 [Cryomyces antarcticus]